MSIYRLKLNVENSSNSDNIADKNIALVGRQTIYDRNLNIFAYELLYRSSETENFAPSAFDGNKATSEVMLNTFLEIGLANIVGEKMAFINMTEQFIDGTIEIPLPKEVIVIEVLENIKPTLNVQHGLHKLKESGYTIALDDFVFDKDLMPLVPFVDIIKVDLMEIDHKELKQHVVAIRKSSSVKLLAEKVETQSDFDFCMDLGFDYFQGYFLERPVIFKGQKIPGNKMAILQLINRLQSPDVDVEELQELIKSDASLSYKILKQINSPAFNIETKVTSVKQALMLLGLDTLKHWVTLVVLSGLSNKSQDIIQKILTRAKMCELLADVIHQKNKDEYFLVGMFSLLDVMLEKDMSLVLESIPIRQELKDALIKHKGKEGKVLSLVIAYEHGNWANMKSGSITPRSLRTSYLAAIQWAAKTMTGLAP